MNELEKLQQAIAGYSMRHWLPAGVGRRLIMLALFLSGVYGIVNNEYYYLIAWPVMLIFSPRAVGELAYFWGRMSRRG